MNFTHANSRVERRYRDLTGMTRARLKLLIAIKSYQTTHYGYGPSFDWVATFCSETLKHASPFVVHELRRSGYVTRGEGVALLGYVLTARGEEKIAELLGLEINRSAAE